MIEIMIKILLFILMILFVTVTCIFKQNKDEIWVTILTKYGIIRKEDM